MTTKKEQTPEMKAVLINGKGYSINSGNKELLKQLPPVKKYNQETKEWEEVSYDYLPIDTVFELLDGLFDNWEYQINDVIVLGKYNKKTTKKNWTTKKEEVTEDIVERMLVKGTLTTEVNGKIKVNSGFAEEVSGSGIYTSDQALNGADAKIDARLLKRLCKRLGKVFRFGEDEADVSERASIAEEDGIAETSITTTKNNIEPGEKSELGFEDRLNLFIAENKDTMNTKQEILDAGKRFKELELAIEGGMREGDDNHKLFQKKFKDLHTKAAE